MRQEPILLRLVEAVNLIDEQERPLPIGVAHPGGIEHAAQIGHAGENRADLHEMQAGFLRQKAGDGGFSHPRRPPQDERAKRARIQHDPERAIRAQQVILPNHISQTRGAQPVGQGARALGRGGIGAGWGRVEQIHGGKANALGAQAPDRTINASWTPWRRNSTDAPRRRSASPGRRGPSRSPDGGQGAAPRWAKARSGSWRPSRGPSAPYAP